MNKSPYTWQVKSLGEVTEIIAGQSPPSSSYNNKKNGLPFFQGKVDFGEEYPSVRVWCSEPTKIALPNDILISVRAPVGPTNICNVKSCIGRGLSAIRTKENNYYKYLFHFLRFIENELMNMGRGSTFSAITQDDLKQIQIPVPPFDIQKQLATLLDKADSIRKKRQESIRLADEFLRSTFLNMFGDPLSNPKNWRKKRIGDFARLQGGYAFESKDYVNKGIKVIRITNVHFENLDWSDCIFVPRNFLEELKDFSLKEGDIVMAMTRPIIQSLNSVKVVRIKKDDLPCLLNQRVGRFVIDNDKLNNNYLLYFTYSEFFKREIRRFSSESLQPNVSSNQVESIEMILPPKNLQDRFSELVNQFEIIKNNYKSFLSESENLFNSLMQRAFKGEL